VKTPTRPNILQERSHESYDAAELSSVDLKNQFSQRSPALFILPGMISGLLFAGIVPAEPTAAISALMLALLSYTLAKHGKAVLWLVAFTGSCILGFWCYGTLRLPSPPDSAALSYPPREARLALTVDRIMQAEDQFGQATGIARVIDAPATSHRNVNNQVFFRLSKKDASNLNLMRGLTIEVTGILHPIGEDAKADSFEGYLQRTGIHYTFTRTSKARLLSEAPFFKRLCHETNNRFQGFLRLGESGNKQLSQIYIAMLLGKKSELSRDQTKRFMETGTMHLFAISGLHIGVIATVIWQMLLVCRLPAKFTPFIGLPLLYFYVEVTGAAPSAVRAFLMVAFFWASIAMRRQRSPLSALAGSAILVLILQPLQLWQMGFQLSYLVVISILLFGLPLRAQLWSSLKPNKYIPSTDWTHYQKAKYWAADKILLLLAISFSAWLASAPLSAGFFGFIAPYAVLINIMLVNLAALIISGGVISITLASLGMEGLAAFLNHSAWLGISAMDLTVRLNTKLPGATIECSNFSSTLSYLGVLAYISSLFTLRVMKHPAIRFAVPALIVGLTLIIGLLTSG